MIAVQIAIILICILGAAFFSGIETGIISIRHLRLRHHLRKGDKRAQELAYFLENPNRLLGTTLVGTNLFIVISSVVSARMAKEIFGSGGEIVSALIITILLLFWGEYLPKIWFRSRPFIRSARFVELLKISWLILRPVGITSTWLAGLIVPSKDSGRKDLLALANREELKLLAEEGEKHGVFTSEERAMIQRTVELEQKPVCKIMTPLRNIVSIPLNASMSDFLSIARKRNLLRFPVWDEETKKYTGTLQVLEVLSSRPKKEKCFIKRFLHKPIFIPQNTLSDEVMPILRNAAQSMGLVTNESNDVIGLITTDDVLKQIV